MAEGKKVKKRLNKKRFAIALAILVVIVAVVLGATVFRENLKKLFTAKEENSFVYHGMTFNKTYFGKILMYETPLVIYRPIQNNTLYWMLKLRNDPRVLDKNIVSNITDKPTRKFYVSFDRYPLECNGSILGSYKIGEFLDALGAYKEATFANEALAEENNNTYKVRNCSHATKDWSVILLKKSDTDKSYLHQDGQCYIMEIANCQTTETTERLILALLDTMKRAPESPETQETPENETNASSS
ncbi:MAG: hypothetical protein ACPLXC_01820 [Candidatus Pacearchaeota archaeon]